MLLWHLPLMSDAVALLICFLVVALVFLSLLLVVVR
jgi:hypothetical protein